MQTQFQPDSTLKLSLHTHLEVGLALLVDLADFPPNEVDDEDENEDLGGEDDEHEGADIAVEAHHVEPVEEPFPWSPDNGGCILISSTHMCVDDLDRGTTSEQQHSFNYERRVKTHVRGLVKIH